MRHYGSFFIVPGGIKVRPLQFQCCSPKLLFRLIVKRRPGKAVCKNAAKLMSPGASWTFLGTFLGAFWERLGACGRFLEPFGSHSGSLVESSGKLLGTFWELCWSVWEPSGSLLGTFWERSGSLLGALWELFWVLSGSLLRSF